MSYVVGLTGGIGSGKSAVADLFVRHGVTVVDTDVIAHELTGPGGPAMPKIINAFGMGVVCEDGRLDRKAMRRRVFSEPSARLDLEAILHPMIREESARRCASAGSPYVLLVVPLLVESGAYRQGLARTLVVDCSEALQVSRVMARSGLSAEEVKAVMATQASRTERLAMADDVIVNESDLESLRTRVDVLHLRYLALAKAINGGEG